MSHAITRLLFLLFLLHVADCYAQLTPELIKNFERTKSLAQKGDAKSQCEIALMYLEGKGVTKDMAESAIWFRKSAEQGNAVAQHNLGLIYQINAPVDYVQAVFWYRKAADQGNTHSQLALAILYDFGAGSLSRDEVEAFKWCSKAAEAGNIDAQSRLGRIYWFGKGVEKDAKKSAFWYLKAAEAGDFWSQAAVGDMYRLGEGLPRDEIESYAWFNLASVSYEYAKSMRDIMESGMSADVRLRAQARTRELQELIEKRKAGKGK